MTNQPVCELCGEPMPEGEEMFKYHGLSGPCPKLPLKDTTADTRRNKVIEIIWRNLPAQPNGLEKAGQIADQIIQAIVRSVPKKRDMSTYEDMTDEGGINITIDEENERLTGNNLAHLAKFAEDKGWNAAIDAMLGEQNND